MKAKAAKLRKEYYLRSLTEAEADRSPVRQFEKWYADCLKKNLVEPNAAALATATKKGAPSIRTVLIKDFDKQGFLFFTNYNSRKGRELKENGKAALLFYWPDLERQVRLEGVVRRISSAESNRYFSQRPFGAQIGAHASAQSRVINGRSGLEERFLELTKRYQSKKVPRPLYWGGYRLIPRRYEFWQGRENRLHDRLEYARASSGRWVIRRLSP